MYIKNISANDIVIGGARFLPEQTRPIVDIGSTEQLHRATESIILLKISGDIEVLYPDGDVVTELSKINNLLLNGFIGVDLNQEKETYYFLKDTFKLKMGESIRKAFNGKVSTVWITPYISPLSIKIHTEEGLTLPAEEISKNQTIEFDFKNLISNPIIEFTATNSTTEVEIFIEGIDSQYSNRELQRFINTWGEDIDKWNTTKPSFSGLYYNLDKISRPTFTENDISGHTLNILSAKTPELNILYKVYKIKDKDFVVEKITDDKWDSLSSDRFFIRAKNISFIAFDDVTIDLSLLQATSSDHISDKLGD